MEEIWKDIPNYNGLYQVSNLGRVKSLFRTMINSDGFKTVKRERILKQYITDKDYSQIILNKNAIRKSIQVHQLIAITFLNHKPDGNRMVVDHIDNNKLNNYLSNLQIITNRENSSKDKKGYSSKYVGVSWFDRDSKWRSRIYINGRNILLGYFNHEFDAHIAYQNKLNKLNNV